MTYLSAIKFLGGKYEECVSAGRRGLEDSPGFAVWHCAALALLGREAEARDELEHMLAQISAHWQGAAEPTRRDMTRWLMHMFPIAVAADWERLRAGVSAAGAPAADLVFGTW